MPHLILEGALPETALTLESRVDRWRNAVLKRADSWTRSDRRAVLVEGVVVEYSRPLLPVAIAVAHHDDTIVRLWTPATVERTAAVQRWLALVAHDLQERSAGRLLSTNLTEDVLEGLELRRAQGSR